MKDKLASLSDKIKSKSARVKELKKEGNESGAFQVFKELEALRAEKSLIAKFLKA